MHPQRKIGNRDLCWARGAAYIHSATCIIRPSNRSLLIFYLTLIILQHLDRYGLGIRFLREKYAKSYGSLSLPAPLPPAGDPDTELSAGEQGGLPMYTSSLPVSQEMERLKAMRVPGTGTTCKVCTEPFGIGEAVMSCHHCGTPAHVRCLAERMLRDAGDESEVIPSEGVCLVPACGRRLLWSRLVKGVYTYRRAACAGDREEAEGSDAHCSAVDHARGPLVWRVDDSSGDEDEDDDDCGDAAGADDYDDDDDVGSDGESDHSARDLASQPTMEDDDDIFWRLSSKSQDCTQWSEVDSVGGDGGVETSRCGQLSSTQELRASDRPQANVSGSGDDVSVIGSTRCRRDYSSSGGGSGLGLEKLSNCSPPSPPTLSLVERLRLRRLDCTDDK